MQIGFGIAELEDPREFEPIDERKKALDCPTSAFLFFVMIFSSLPSYMVNIECGSYDDIFLIF